MRERGIDALVVPSSDPHLSEYLPARWQGRQWLSGFTGSSGTLVVTQDFAGVWTDARYWEQAEAELSGSDVVLVMAAAGAGLAYIGWLAVALKPGQTVAVDGCVLALSAGRALRDTLAAHGIGLRLRADGVELAAYSTAAMALAMLDDGATLLLDPQRTTTNMRAAAPAAVRIIEAVNPTTLSKSRKTDHEAAQVRATMEQDGAALCEFFAWLDEALAAASGDQLTELDIDTHICAARARRPDFVGPSFPTIAGFNANGAVIHYRATAQAHASIAGDGLLLIDSGGQYLGGTSDITRMVAVEKRNIEINL